MSGTDDLVPVLRRLKLSGILQTLQLRTTQAVEDQLAHPEFLYRVLSDEIERREAKMLAQRIRRAGFEHQKSLEDFNFLFNPQVPKAKVIDLATCGFVRQHKNVLLIGPAGVGKSHIAQALGHRACRAGYKVLFLAAHDLFKQLRAARGDGTHEKKLQKLTSIELLIIDDLGLRPLHDDEPIELYDIIRLRHEKHSTVITSNRDLKEMPRIFNDPLLASAAMDRLFDDAHVIVIEGHSYRNPPPEKRKLKQKNQSKQVSQ